MIFLVIIGILFSVLCADSGDAGSFSVDVASSLLTEEAAVGDTVELVVNTVFPNEPLFWIFDSLIPPMSMGMEFLGTATKTRTYIEDSEQCGETQITLRFSPTRAGQLNISPWRWRVFHIPEGDTTQIDTVIMDFSGFVLTGYPCKKSNIGVIPYMLLVIGVIFIVLLTAFIRRMVLKYRKEPVEPAKPITPEEKAIDALNKLSLQRMQTDELLDNLSRILRSFIDEKFDIPAGGMSSAEIIEHLSEKGAAGHKFIALQQALKYCDDVRFAEKYPESREIKEALEQAKIFIEE